MGLRKTFTSVAAAMLCKLLTDKLLMGLPLSILWANTLEEGVILAYNDFSSIVGEEREWYPVKRLNSVSRVPLEIQSTPPHWHRKLISELEPIRVVTMSVVSESIKIVIKEKTHPTNFQFGN
jgi:hypothetical protein